jgi:hypothetical protein
MFVGSMQRRTRHVILIVNGGGVRKKEYYEHPVLAQNVRRIASEGFVFEEDHCDTISSHHAAFAELVSGLDYVPAQSLALIPTMMRKYRPRILVCREFVHDVGHEDYEAYLRAVRTTDSRIGAIFDWVKQDPYFSKNTAIVIRPEFGRDDEVNMYGQLHHSYGFYYTHRVASIFWGPDVTPGVDRKTVVNRKDMTPTVAGILSTRFQNYGNLLGGTKYFGRNISPLFQGGVDAPSRNIPVPLKGAAGAVVKVA